MRNGRPERTRGRAWIQACLTAHVALLCASCSADPVRSLQRQAVGMRPRLLESCLPEAGEVELIGDTERLTYAWTLGERFADRALDDLDAVGSFQTAPTGPGAACKVTVQIEDGLVRAIEVGEARPSAADADCAARVRACLAHAPDSGAP